MKKLQSHIHILFTILLLLTATVAMGQGRNEAVVPIKNVAVWEQHKVDGHPLTNLYDGDKGTTWSSYRDGFPVLEYMHIKNPDPTGNGQRHWVELPYTPNNNTEIEITFKAKTTSGGLKQNILGFGYPPFGNGMSLNIGGDGKILFGTSNHIHTLAAQADNQKHTVICSATSVTIDGGVNLMPGTIDPDNSDPDVIQDGHTSQHNLCLFSNPAEDQKWARCFDGDIYSVKIRESGKLLYDLVPTRGWWGRPGFYDRISTEIFTFFDMVDYVSNTDVTDGAPLHIHYKIPYEMGSGTTARTQWTGNLVTNGDFASDDTTSFTFVKDIFVPRIASDVNGKYIQVYNNGTHPEGNVWDCHLRVDLTEELEAGETYTLSFYAKASKNAVATFDFSNAAGDYHSGYDRITSDVKDVPFTTDWVQRTYTIVGKDVTDKGLIKGIGLNLNNEKSAVLYNVAAFELKKQGETNNLVADHSNYTDLSGYPINDAIDKTWTSRIITVDGKRCAQVVNNAAGANSWDCQMRVNLSETLSEGDQYSISFNIKAKQAADISGQLQMAGGGYYGGLPVKSVGTTWKRVEWTGTVGANSGEVGAIALLLNETKTANTYYITDVVVKKGTPSSDQVPNTELEITYKNTYAGASVPVKTNAVWGTPASNGAWNSGTNVYSWTAGYSNLATVFDTPDGKLAKYTSLHFNAADYVTDCPYRVCFMQGSNAVATITFYSGGQKDLVFAERTETKDLDLSTIDRIAFGGASNSGSITVTNMYFDGTGEDTQSTRYLFSYDTKEKNVLALGVKENKYWYTTGGVTNDFGDVPNIKNETITTTFRPTEFVRGSVYNVTGATTWNTAVKNFYLFGTHSTNDQYARSFIGEIYGAVIREGGVVKVELQPAWKDGVYGFYDRRTNTFYTKDEDDDDLCGKGANFRGVTGHDAQAPVDHSEGIPTAYTVYPNNITIDLASPKVVKNFYMKTAADNIGNYTNNSPARWTLYGSSGDDQWTELYKYEQTVPKFSALNAGTTPEPSGTAYKSASELESATTYYLYNVETGRFLMSEGRQVSPDWGTRAYIQPNNAWKVKVTLKEGKYTIFDCNLTKEPGGSRWYELYAFDNGNVWTDYDGRTGTDFCCDWNITSIGNNQYEISSPDLILGAKLGTSATLDVDSDKRLYLSAEAKNTTWAFVSEEDYNAYQAAKNITKGDPMLNDREYKYAINAANAEYKQFRLVIDRLVANNNQINLAELVFTTNVDFQHYVGRVYDNMGEQPDNLKVGGSSGYTTEYKTRADDPRLGVGVTIQRTHEYEHEIYLLPGATVDLTPFSDFGSTAWNAYNYREQYVRWFDYKTDLLSSRLTFDSRNGLNVNSLDEGHFAWNLREDPNITKDEWRRSREGSLAHYTADANPVSDANGVIDVIAIEAGGIFDWDAAVWDAGKNAYVAKEPTLLWRHTFVIKDAKRRSDEMFADAAANNTYVQNHKIKLMCPANVPFQYPLPSFEDKEINATHPTNFYYRTAVDTYEPVYHYSIETVKDGVRLGATNVSFQNVAPEGEGKEDQMARSFKDIEGYNRVFYIKNPQIGKYTISIHAMNTNCSGGARDDRMGPTTPLLLMQYELEVLPPADGIMVNEEELNSRDDLAHQRPENMKASFGKPTTKVDFDEVLPSQITSVSNGHSYLKWPWQWENSSYGFGYEKRGDYNMYMVTDHMTVTPYHGRESGATDEVAFKNVYDRKYYDNGQDLSKKGYFFYANAASDPSRMSTLNIGKSFCENTKVYVSAWINEFQGKDLYAETANVIFSFRGVKADGTETVINSFVTGYISGGWNTPTGYFPKTKAPDPKDNTKEIDVINHVDPETNPDNRGKWMHVYYTFVPEIVNANEYDHYIITLENNCTSSEGADYAIDDIRAYVLKPQVNARLLQPVCNGSTSTDIQVFGDFEQLKMAYFSEQTPPATVSFYYSFLDREKYETKLQQAYDKGVKGGQINSTTYPSLQDWRENANKASDPFLTAYRNAFNEALIKGAYNTGADDWYGNLTINTTYDNNNGTEKYEAGNQLIGGRENIVFPCTITNSQIKAGKEYLVALIRNSSQSMNPAAFALEDQCSSVSVFEIPKPLVAKLDGSYQSELDGMSYCINQRPEVSIDLNGVAIDGEPVKPGDVKFDWYYGPLELLAEQTEQGYKSAYRSEEKDGLKLYDAVSRFRAEYPNATQDDVMDGTVSARNGFTDAMLAYIKEMVTKGKLLLYSDKAYATAHLFSESLYPYPDKLRNVYITALPIDPNISNVLFCIEPLNVTIKLNEMAPKMKDGEGMVAYPNDMYDVPLRIGLSQLKNTTIEDLDDDRTIDKQLWLPLRTVTPVTVGVTNLIKSDDFMVYLTGSDDPDVLKGRSGAKLISDDSGEGNILARRMLVVGKVLDISANKGWNSSPYNPGSPTTGNYCKMAFLKSFKFREGYYYTMLLHYKERYEDSGDHSNVCPGDMVFTIKVVPEYQMWTGAVSRNWNDDRNWKRVAKDELLWDDGRKTAHADYITDGGTNDNTASFAPADFTKVIIPAGLQRVPYMYNMHENANQENIHFTGAPAPAPQFKTTRPADSVYNEIFGSDSNDQTSIDLDGKMFVITDRSGTRTLGVTLKEGVRPGGPQDAFVVNNSIYTDDMYVYAKFNRVVKAGVDGDVYTIQLYNANGENHSVYGGQGYLNFQPTGNIVFALGLNGQYGQDGENLALWRVAVVGDGVTIKNVGREAYLNPSDNRPSTEQVICQLVKSFSAFGSGEVLHLASLVQYDMASVERSDGNIACRPWYDHTCDQIHFMAGAELMDQRYLYYNKAWADIDVTPGIWQTVASPLTNIVAGDLYLPTASARQETPLFENITYDPDFNDRFKPAVFQRSWNASMAKVYQLNVNAVSPASPITERNVGIKLDWSKVYNDVNVQYGAGTGFAIKVDVSAMPAGSQPATSKFRLPKADTRYTYYNPGNADGTYRTENVKDPEGHDVASRPGRLADLTSAFQQVVGDKADDATATSYFLVGNPLMCWLDMEEFFNANTQFEKKYWVVTGEGQRAALFSETEGWITTSDSDPKFIAPGKSFFVKLKDVETAVAYLSPTFTAAMMSYTQGEVAPQQRNVVKTRGGVDDDPSTSSEQAYDDDGSSLINIAATAADGRQTKAVLMDGATVRHGGVETLFDSNLKDDVLLYTTRNGQAMTITDIAPGDTLPLIISGAQTELRLSIRGVETFHTQLYLYDTESGETQPLDSSITLTQRQNGVKYYILAEPTAIEQSHTSSAMPRITTDDHQLTVTLTGDGTIRNIRIYTVGGVMVDQQSDAGSQYSISLPANVYIVDMDVDGKHYTYKIAL